MPLTTQSERGSILVLTALALTALLGIAALAIDVGSFYAQRNRMAAAADAAARSAALELVRTADLTVLTTFGRDAALRNGFTNGGSVSVAINHPPSSNSQSTFYHDPSYVEAVITDTSPPSFFIGAFFFLFKGSFTPPTISVGAVAGGRMVPDCIMALSPNATHALSLNSAAQLTAPGCAIVVNSNAQSALYVNSASFINVSPGGVVDVVGTWYHDSSSYVSPSPTTGAAVQADPFASLTAPTSGSCTTQSGSINSGANVTLQPGTFCSGIYINSASHATLTSGTYIITSGGFTANSGSFVSGTGVTLYIASGSFLINSGTTVNLSAPTSGPLAGILVWQPSANTQAALVNSGSGGALNGVLYFPGANLTFNSAASSNSDYTFIAASTVSFNSAGTLKSNVPSALMGGVFQLTTLAE